MRNDTSPVLSEKDFKILKDLNVLIKKLKTPKKLFKNKELKEQAEDQTSSSESVDNDVLPEVSSEEENLFKRKLDLKSLEEKPREKSKKDKEKKESKSLDSLSLENSQLATINLINTPFEKEKSVDSQRLSDFVSKDVTKLKKFAEMPKSDKLRQSISLSPLEFKQLDKILKPEDKFEKFLKIKKDKKDKKQSLKSSRSSKEMSPNTSSLRTKNENKKMLYKNIQKCKACEGRGFVVLNDE